MVSVTAIQHPPLWPNIALDSMEMSGRGCVQIKPNLQKQDAASWIWPTDHHLQLRPKLVQSKSPLGDACFQGPEERGLTE